MGGAVARVDRVADTQTSIEYEFHGLGNSTLATIDQATGSVNSALSYSPFGAIIEATDGGGSEGLSSHRRRWNDKFVDEASGLAYYGARFCDRTSMTWTQGDPLYRFLPEGRWSAPRRGNLYTFSLNNPLRYLDPDGRDVFTRGITHWSKNTSNAGLTIAWQKEARGATTGGAELGAPRSSNKNITATSRYEVVAIDAVFAPGETGIPQVDADH
jgi:RHS repeat-associated protein